MSASVQVAREGAVAVLTINRPDVLNALDTGTLDALRQAVAGLGDDPAVRALIVTGAGDRAFVAGADVRELAGRRPAEARAYARSGQRLFDMIEQLGKPVIAAINGFALGGGCELAMACTLRIAAETARLGQPEVQLGLIPGFAGTQRLARLVGTGAALDLLLTGRQVTADEALRMGLVNRVVAPGELMAAARQLAGELASRPPLAVRYVIEAVHHGSNAAFDAAQTLEAALFGLAASTDDMREGTAAFLEKRKAIFRGE
jgi:enoyl-CoA hydratase